jgi:hypothetical protein
MAQYSNMAYLKESYGWNGEKGAPSHYRIAALWMQCDLL